MTDSSSDLRFEVLHAVPMGACVMDTAFTVLFWNRCLETWTRMAARDILGRDLREVFPHLHQARFQTRFELLFRGGPPVIFSARLHGNIIPAFLPGGAPRLQHTVARLLRCASTQPCVLLTMQDMTEAQVRLSDYARMHEQAQNEIERRRKAEAVLRESEERFSSAFEYAANGMALMALDGTWMKVNQALCDMLGCTVESLTGRTIREVTVPEDYDLGARQRDRLLQGQIKAYQVEKRFRTKNGRPLWVHLSVSLVRGDQDEPLYFIVQIENIDKRKQMEEELYILATTDPLTGINNRREFLARADFEVQRSRRQQSMLAFLMVDIDSFKSINDTWGHAAGDDVLRAMVETSRNVLRATDVFGRLGGEEFGIVLTDVNRGALEDIAERVRVAAADLGVGTPTGTIHFTVSIGLAFFTDALRSLDDLMRRADLALYEAKTLGRNRVCVAGDTEMRCLWPPEA